MKKMNRGAISIFALLSMMFFLIFIMVAYNNVMQKAKVQVETEGVLIDYYKSSQDAGEIVTAENGGNVNNSNKGSVLRESKQQEQVTSANASANKYVFSNGKIYKITN